MSPQSRRTAPRVLRATRRRPRSLFASDAAAMVEAPPPPSAIDEPVLAVNEIQGNILPGFSTAHLALLGLRIRRGEESAARLWLRDLTPLVTSFEQAWHLREVRRAVAKAMHAAPPRPGVLLNAALSFEALGLLRLPTGGIPPGLFQSGMWTADLQDPLDEQGTPIGWKVGATPETTPHVLLILGADSADDLDEALNVLVAHTGPESGFDKMYDDRGHRLEGDTEHFGFRDGISQPGVRGRRDTHPDSVATRRYIPPDDPLSERFARPGQPLIWPGQFIFGYATQNALEGPGPIAVPPEPWMENGAFLVFRRLRQDVQVFERFARDEAARLTSATGRTITPGVLKAWLVGRWPDGTPLVRGPEAPSIPPEDDFSLNHFDYADGVPGTAVLLDGGLSQLVAAAPGDDVALRCPHFAHIRKVNLRDKLTDQGPSANFRMLRRGIPFGAPDDDDRGLLFLAYMRDIQQFMTVSTTWMNNTAAPEGHGHDLLVGQTRSGRTATRLFADATSVEVRVSAEQRWVIPTGGGFFFAPARSVLAALQP